MTTTILIVALVLILCVAAEKCSDRLGLPALILFMFIGMLCGSDGILKIQFADFSQAETICSVCLVFIMFYSGFNTKWSAAKSVAGKAVVMSTLGVAATAGLTTVGLHYLLRFSWQEGFLVGAVLSCTDAASVFAILRKHKLNLKEGTASLLEVESGSNDPMAYMLTVIAVGLLGFGEQGSFALQLVLQLVVGLAVGCAAAWVSRKMLDRWISDGLETVFLIAMVLLCYGVSSLLGGNAYLSLYLFGILLGNRSIRQKRTLISFFDGVTRLAQIAVFFVIGLLSFPKQMPANLPMALAVCGIVTFLSRPIATYVLLRPAKCSLRQIALVSWAGLRGASSTVFAIMAVAAGVTMHRDLFHVVFTVTLLSAAVQGGLLPWVAKRLEMVDDSQDVRKTFNDYQEESVMHLARVEIIPGHPWADHRIREIQLPTGSLAVLLRRGDESIVTRGDTVLLPGDSLILSMPPYIPTGEEMLEETEVLPGNEWVGKTLRELNLPEDRIVVTVLRQGKAIIPDGSTTIRPGDTLVQYRNRSAAR